MRRRSASSNSSEGTIRRITVSKAPFPAGYVRLSTRPLKRVPFPCSSSEYCPQTSLTLLGVPAGKILDFSRGVDWRSALSKPHSAMRSRTSVYAPASQFALNCKKAAHPSGFPFACARLLLFPAKRARFDPTENSFGGDPTLRRFAGTPIEALFRASHLNESVRAFEAF